VSSVTAEPKALAEAAPPLLAWPLSRLPLHVKLALLSITVGVLALVGVVGSHEYPRGAARDGTQIEGEVAELFRDPTLEAWDRVLLGDLLVERFYIVDPTSGERYVADLLKGRIDGIQSVPREDQLPAYVFVLTTKDMRRDKAFYNAYMKAVAQPEKGSGGGRYLGALMPTGDRDAFPLNYNGGIPVARAPFHVGDDDNPYAYMLRQNFKDITEPRGLNVSGYTYVLSSSTVFPVFKDEYKLDKTIFLSELLVVDTTSRQNKTTYYKLLDQYPRSSNP
jgi:hypothetical protein